MGPCAKITPSGLLLKVYIQAGARKTEITGLYQERLKIRIAAPAVDGKANKALVQFLAGIFCMPASKLDIIKGLKSQQKDILLQSPERRARELLEKLTGLATR